MSPFVIQVLSLKLWDGLAVVTIVSFLTIRALSDILLVVCLS